ncbi:MAG TPA: GTP-binding protein [Planctomycetota bacterium]|nr:GTP-binding protein [Planctomycetota bacterium]
MLIKKYSGPHEKAVLSRVRADLGPDAVILHSSLVRPTGIARLFRRPRFEVVAGGGFRIVRDYPNGSPPVSPPTIRKGAAPPVSPEQLQKEISEIKTMIARRARAATLTSATPEIHEEFAALSTARVSDDLARSLFQRITERLSAVALRDRTAIKEAIRASVKASIKCADGIALSPGRCVKVAFVGPTGVGKTTTIAKLISIYAYRGQEVAVVTNDTYRIAASEQIKRVAQLVGVPVRVCRTGPEMTEAVNGFADRDLVLIDTAGRSQKDDGKIDDLCATLKSAGPDEVHLVLSSTTSSETLVDTVKRFSPCGFTKIVITKLDEAMKVGLVLDVLSKVDQRLSFITTGQEIPRDIEIADSDRMTSLILGEEPL